MSTRHDSPIKRALYTCRSQQWQWCKLWTLCWHTCSSVTCFWKARCSTASRWAASTAANCLLSLGLRWHRDTLTVTVSQTTHDNSYCIECWYANRTAGHDVQCRTVSSFLAAHQHIVDYSVPLQCHRKSHHPASHKGTYKQLITSKGVWGAL